MSKPLALFLVVVLVFFSLFALWLIRENWPNDRHDRAHEANNLKQIGLALHDYHQTEGSFPPGTISNQELPHSERLSWVVPLLPYLEQDNLYRTIDRGKAWNAKPNAAAVNLGMYVFTGSYDDPISHYVGMAGIGMDAPDLPISDPKAGVFGYDRKTRVSDIKDGTANTIMVVPTDRDIGHWAAGGPSTVRGIDTDHKPYFGRNRQFGGILRGGSYVLFADGSIRWIKDSIDSTTFEALSTIAGGEKIDPSFDY